MTDTRFVRWANLGQLASRYPTMAEFGRRSGVSQTQLNSILKDKGDGSPVRLIGEKLARRIETNLALEPRWLDVPHDESEVGKLPAPSLGSSPAPGTTGLLPTAERTSTATENPDLMNVAGLTLLQKAAVDALIKLARQGGLSNSDCVKLLGTWTSQLEQAAENQSSAQEG